MLTGGSSFHYRGKHVSFQRSKHALRQNTSLIKIEGVDDPKAATFYNGKRIAYVYRGKKEIRGTKIRVIWGKVTRPHGTFLARTYPGRGRMSSRRIDIKGSESHGRTQQEWHVLTDISLTGNSGVVRAQFKHNLPPKSLGAMVRVMLYPSSI